MFKSLTGKIWFYIILLIVFILAISWIMQVYLLEKIYINQRVHELTQEGQELNRLLIERNTLKVQQKLRDMAAGTKGRITIVDYDGSVTHINNYMGFRRNLSLTREELLRVFEGKRVVYKTTNTGGTMMESSTLTVAMPMKDEEDDVFAALILNVPVENMNEAIMVIKTQFLYISLGAILLSIIFAYGISTFLSRPLVKMNKIAQSMAEGDFNVRITNPSKDEIGQLSNTLNFMAKSLDNTMSNLNQNNQKLNNILSSIGDGVVTLDIKGRVLHFNSSALKFIDIPREGEYIDSSHFLYQWIQQVKDLDEGLYMETEKDGRILSIRVTPYHNNGVVIGAVIIISDITKEKNLERLRKEFIANVSHELRTPISLIQGYSEALKDGVARDINKEDEFIEIIYSESERLAKLVEDILDVSSMESGEFRIESQPFDIYSLVQRVISRVKVMAAKAEIDIVNEIDDSIPLVEGDEKRIEQVIINLINNAIANTPASGTIRVRACPIDDRVEVEIEDTGRGIPKDQLQHIWDRFYRVDKARNRKDGGTGLGLSIVKNILASHKSQFGVESSEGIGTKFYFTLKQDR